MLDSGSAYYFYFRIPTLCLCLSLCLSYDARALLSGWNAVVVSSGRVVMLCAVVSHCITCVGSDFQIFKSFFFLNNSTWPWDLDLGPFLSTIFSPRGWEATWRRYNFQLTYRLLLPSRQNAPTDGTSTRTLSCFVCDLAADWDMNRQEKPAHAARVASPRPRAARVLRRAGRSLRSIARPIVEMKYARVYEPLAAVVQPPLGGASDLTRTHPACA
jgi:hypothetical protein